MRNYSFTNVLEYIPKKYVGLSNKQLQDRQAVYSFKDGNCPQYVKDLLVDKIRNVICDNPSSWVVCFIPASTNQRFIRRYSALSSYLNSHLDCDVCMNGIEVAYDKESGYMSGKTGNPIDNMQFNPSVFRGKKVVLIDDVRTRGVTFNNTAEKLSNLGAVTVFGVFVAQTIHPNLPVDTTPHPRGGWYDDAINDMIADQMYEEEMAAEAMADMMYEDEMQAEMMADMMYEDEMQAEMMAEYYGDDDPGLYM